MKKPENDVAAPEMLQMAPISNAAEVQMTERRSPVLSNESKKVFQAGKRFTKVIFKHQLIYLHIKALTSSNGLTLGLRYAGLEASVCLGPRRDGFHTPALTMTPNNPPPSPSPIMMPCPPVIVTPPRYQSTPKPDTPIPSQGKFDIFYQF